MAKRIKSGLKRTAIAERNRQRNMAAKSEMKTRIKKVNVALSASSSEIKPLMVEAISNIDRAARKGVIHANKAARLKSRMMKRANAVAIAQ